MKRNITLFLSGLFTVFITSCTENTVSTEAPSSETTAIVEEPKGLPLNPAKTQWEDFTFDVAIRSIDNAEQLILILRKGAFMNQTTKPIEAGFALKGSGSFDYNENGKPELVICSGNSSTTKIHIFEVDSIGSFSELNVTGDFTVLPEAVHIELKDSRVLLSDSENRVLGALQPVNNDGTLEFNAE